MNTVFKSLLISMLFIMGIVGSVNSQVYYDTLCEADSSVCSSAIGSNSKASGQSSFAGGLNSYASGNQSFAFGENDTVTGESAFALGKLSKATRQFSFACGYHARAFGEGSVAMGLEAYAQNFSSVSIGFNNQALGLASVSIGSHTVTEQDYAITLGCGIINNQSYPLYNYTDGIMLGMNSVNPTLFITRSDNDGVNKLYNTGKVGIGAAVPQAKFHIISDPNEIAGMIIQSTNQAHDSAYIQMQDENHFLSVGTDNRMWFSAGNGKMIFKADSYCFGSENAFIKNNGNEEFSIIAPENMTMAASKISISGNDAVDMDAQEITLNGKIGINAANDVEGFSLAVGGGIITDEVLIKDVGAWHDYVFGKNYGLMPLNELKAYISENQHLPDVPSEKEVMENGIELSEMQGILLKKIEELTLYTLKQQEMLEQLQKQNAMLQNRIEELENK